MSDHMNVYRPYERKIPTHEDNLTRAFLIVLKGVPAVHSAFLQLVDAAHRRAQGEGVPLLHQLSAPVVETQTGAISENVNRVVSVLMTDENYFAEKDVAQSSRKQVLDGVVAYPPELALAVENKPFHGNVWEGQLSVNIPEGSKHDPKVACVMWRDVVSVCTNLMQSGHLGPAERLLVDDFLEYVETFFPKLQPYSNIAVCGRDHYRLKRRCRMLLEELKLGPVKHTSSGGWGWYIDLQDKTKGHAVAIRIALRPVPEEAVTQLNIELALADTVGQARLLFDKFEYSALEELQRADWRIEPNFHLAFIQQNLFYPTTTASIADYWRFWKAHQDLIRQVPRNGWPELLKTLIQNGVAREEDRTDFDEKFTTKKRDFVNVCPGISTYYSIPLEEAGTLDTRGKLSARLRDVITNIARVLELPLEAPLGVGASRSAN